jgi:hypothetical protein
MTWKGSGGTRPAAAKDLDELVGTMLGAAAEELRGLDEEALVADGSLVELRRAPEVVLVASPLAPFGAPPFLDQADELVAGVDPASMLPAFQKVQAVPRGWERTRVP